MYITSYKTYEFERKLIYKNIYKYTAMTPSHRSENPRAVSGHAPKDMHSAPYPGLTIVPITVKKTTLLDVLTVIRVSNLFFKTVFERILHRY